MKNHTNPIGYMQELVSNNFKENIIISYDHTETLDLSFIGLFRLSPESFQAISTKKNRKAMLFSLTIPFVLFYIQHSRLFDLNATYHLIILYRKRNRIHL